MGSPLGLAGIFFDLLARTHLQRSWSPHCLWLHLLLLDRCLTGPTKEQFAHHFLQEDRFGPEEIVRKVAELNGDDGPHLDQSCESG